MDNLTLELYRQRPELRAELVRAAQRARAEAVETRLIAPLVRFFRPRPEKEIGLRPRIRAA